MKILVVGGSGIVGSTVVDAMQDVAEVISVSRNSSAGKVDITSTDSIKQMFEHIGKVDALVSMVGTSNFCPIEELTPEKNDLGVQSKLLGQINLVLLGLNHIRDKGSITLTTGVLLAEPVVTAASATMANGGVHAFLKSTAVDMPRGIRINTVSPNVLEEAVERYGSLFEGFQPVQAKAVGLAYRKSILGAQTGESFYVY